MFLADERGPRGSQQIVLQGGLEQEREMQIALMIAECQKVQSISDKLCLSPKTVNTYRYRIFDKLEITSDVELAVLAIRHGMVEVDS